VRLDAGVDASGGSGDLARAPDLATSEVCDGVDNDGDSVVDEGCPTGVMFGVPTHASQLGTAAGSLVSASCPAGQVLVGFVFSETGCFLSVAARCAPLEVTESKGTTPFTYSLQPQLASITPTASYGSAVGTLTTVLDCPPRAAAYGLQAKHGVLPQSSNGSTPGVIQLSLWCATFEVRGGPGSFFIARGPDAQATTTLPADLSKDCPYTSITSGAGSGSVCSPSTGAALSIGFYGSASGLLASIGSLCASPMLLLRP
jgi:hypothetical protein